MQKQRIPGLSLAVLKNGEILKLEGYGLANVELQVPATPDTIYQSGSVGKQFTAAGILLLAEDGKIGLDDPVHKYVTEGSATLERRKGPAPPHSHFGHRGARTSGTSRSSSAIAKSPPRPFTPKSRSMIQKRSFGRSILASGGVGRRSKPLESSRWRSAKGSGLRGGSGSSSSSPT